jgi:hypothetical protein
MLYFKVRAELRKAAAGQNMSGTSPRFWADTELDPLQDKADVKSN